MSQIVDVSPLAVTNNRDINRSVIGRMLSVACSSDGQTLYAGSYSNLWTSHDSGQTWDQLVWPQPDPAQFDVPGSFGGWCVVDIALSPVDPQTVLVITRIDRTRLQNRPDNGIWRSTDGGNNWTLVHQFPADPNVVGNLPAAGQLVWAPGSENLVYAAGGTALTISQDGGAHFQDVAEVGRINHVAVAASVPSAPAPPVVYALGDGVMFVAISGGPWVQDSGSIQPNWGGAVGIGANSQGPAVLVVSPRSPLEVFLVANANGGQTVGPQATAGPSVSAYQNQQHFAYVDFTGTISDSWWDGDHNQWKRQQINGASGLTEGPAAIGALSVSAYQKQQHFAYVSEGGVVWDSWWDGDHNNQWKKQQINLSAMQLDPEAPVRTDGPAAKGGLSVSAYNNQQHFAYVDDGGIVWDSWWDGDHNQWNLQQINGGPMIWRGDYTQFFSTHKSIWEPVILPDLSGQDSGNVFIATTQTGRGDLLFYGAQRLHGDGASAAAYVGPLYPAAASDWHSLDPVHVDLHGLLLSPDFAGTIQNGNYAPEAGRIWLLSDGGIYWSTNGGKQFNPSRNARTLASVSVAGVATQDLGPALSLNTGDNDGFYSNDGGQNWSYQDYGGGDNDGAFADPFRPHAMLICTPRWDTGANLGPRSKGQTVAVYQTDPGKLPDVRGGTHDRRVVTGPPVGSSDIAWNAQNPQPQSYISRGTLPVVLGLPEEEAPPQGDYIFILDPSGDQPQVVRTQNILDIADRSEWLSTATGPGQGANVYLQGPPLPVANRRGATVRRGFLTAPSLPVPARSHYRTASFKAKRHWDSISGARTAASFLSRNSPSEMGTATLSIRVNSRNPTAKMPAATRSSVTVG